MSIQNSYSSEEKEELKSRVESCKYGVKIYSNGRGLEEQTEKSLYDSSVGVHWSVYENITREDSEKTIKAFKEFNQRAHPGQKPRSVDTNARQMAVFQHEIKNGDDIILGVGSCDGKKDFWVARVVTNCYFDNREIWVNTPPGSIKMGPFHRRKLDNIVRLPSGTSLSTPGTFRLKTVGIRPTTGWGIEIP